jgi:hypothetical protein
MEDVDIMSAASHFGEEAAQAASLVFGLRANTDLDSKRSGCDAELMTHAAQKLVEEFEALPDDARSEVVAELVRRVASLPHDLPSDTDLVAAADQLFLELDRREQPQ